MSVEDINGCKRQLSVPGISVNVKRVKVRSDVFLLLELVPIFLISPRPNSTHKTAVVK